MPQQEQLEPNTPTSARYPDDDIRAPLPEGFAWTPYMDEDLLFLREHEGWSWRRIAKELNVPFSPLRMLDRYNYLIDAQNRADQKSKEHTATCKRCRNPFTTTGRKGAILWCDSCRPKIQWLDYSIDI